MLSVAGLERFELSFSLRRLRDTSGAEPISGVTDEPRLLLLLFSYTNKVKLKS